MGILQKKFGRWLLFLVWGPLGMAAPGRSCFRGRARCAERSRPSAAPLPPCAPGNQPGLPARITRKLNICLHSPRRGIRCRSVLIPSISIIDKERHRLPLTETREGGMVPGRSPARRARSGQGRIPGTAAPFNPVKAMEGCLRLGAISGDLG